MSKTPVLIIDFGVARLRYKIISETVIVYMFFFNKPGNFVANVSISPFKT